MGDEPVKFTFTPIKVEPKDNTSPPIKKEPNEVQTPVQHQNDYTTPVHHAPSFPPTAPIKRRGKTKIARALSQAQARASYERERDQYEKENKWLAYMDESCHNNGRPNAYAGFGVFFGDGDHKNIAAKVPKQSNHPQTNNSAALYALLYLFRVTPETQSIVIRPDSTYAENVITQWMQKWQKNGWKKADGAPPLNLDIVQQLYEMWTPTREKNTTFSWVEGHSHTYGNDKADELANQGAALHVMEEGGSGGGGGTDQKTPSKLEVVGSKKRTNQYRLPAVPGAKPITPPPAAVPPVPPSHPVSYEAKAVQVKMTDGKLVEPYSVYVGRECHRGGLNLNESKWANPYTRHYTIGNNAEDEVCRLYREYIVRAPFFLDGLIELRGQVLGCLCPSDTPCHAHILARFANQAPHMAGLQVIEGNILNTDTDVILHMAQDQNRDGFSSDLSRQFQIPVPTGEIGSVQLTPIAPSRFIAWCFAKSERTEENRINAFREALRKLADWVKKTTVRRIAVPYGIGCGKYGRGNWVRYAQCLQDLQQQLPMTTELVVVRREE